MCCDGARASSGVGRRVKAGANGRAILSSPFVLGLGGNFVIAARLTHSLPALPLRSATVGLSSLHVVLIPMQPPGNTKGVHKPRVSTVCAAGP